MARIPSLERDEIAEHHREMLERIESVYGPAPNSFGVLGRVPGLLDTVAELSLIVMREGKLGADVKWLAAHVASRAAGCTYCSAHTGYHAHTSAGVDARKVEAVWDFETSPLFDDAERAALRLARDAAVLPNAVTDAHFTELGEHLDADQAAELVAAIALFGFFNRWNDTLATDLEDAQAAFGAQRLAAGGWSARTDDRKEQP